jgi:hypothetical protein
MIKNCWECENLRHNYYDEKQIQFSFIECKKIESFNLLDIVKMDDKLVKCKDKIYELCPLGFFDNTATTWNKAVIDKFDCIAKSIKEVEIKKLKKDILDRRFQRLLSGKIKQIEYQNKIFMLHPFEKNKIVVLYKDKIDNFKMLKPL